MGEIKQFLPLEASAQEWGKFHEYRHLRHAEERPDDPITPDDIVEKRMKRENPFYDSRYFGHWESGEIVSLLETTAVRPAAPDYANNKHIFWANAAVLAPHRRVGIGKGWVETVLGLASQFDASTISSWTEEDDGHAFLKWLGATEKLVESENRLDFTKIDWGMVEKWISDGPAQSPGTKLEFFESSLPDEVLEQYSPVYTRILNTIPKDEATFGDDIVTPETFKFYRSRREDLGHHHHTYITREPDGAISGMTEMMFQPEKPHYVYQDLTGVIPEYRGRGLGKWLKAAMLDYVRQTLPDTHWVITGNANSNGPMLAINHALGFKAYRGQSNYEIDVKTLESSFVEIKRA